MSIFILYAIYHSNTSYDFAEFYWVEYDDAYYYVGSDGAKTINDWRFVLPEGADEDEDEEWFYFGSKGKMVTGKEVINGKHTISIMRV